MLFEVGNFSGVWCLSLWGNCYVWDVKGYRLKLYWLVELEIVKVLEIVD